MSSLGLPGADASVAMVKRASRALEHRHRRVQADHPRRARRHDRFRWISARDTAFRRGPYTSQTAIAGASRRAFSVAVGRSARGV
jgi:hypothetical protein